MIIQANSNSAIFEHNKFPDNQGGQVDEYYHLTSGQATALTNSGNTSLHKHDVYSLVDGTRDYTDIVSYNNHKTFLLDTDIPDKKYVDDASAGGTVNHEFLLGLLGGSTNNHYHLTNAQHTGLTSGASTNLHAHDIYSLSDGTRDYFGIVKYNNHKSFSSDTDLIDKKYVDDAVGGGTVNHENLVGLLGGTSNQHYHLTSGQYSELTTSGSTTLHAHPNLDKVIYVIPSLSEVTGIRYKTIPNAQTYILSVQVSGEKWVVKGSGINAENFEVQENIIIDGEGDWILNGEITSDCVENVGNDVDDYVIKNCTITNLNLLVKNIAETDYDTSLRIENCKMLDVKSTCGGLVYAYSCYVPDPSSVIDVIRNNGGDWTNYGTFFYNEETDLTSEEMQGAIVELNDWLAGLGGAADLNVGTSEGTVAAGDDSRFPNNISLITNNFLTSYNSGNFSQARPTWANIDKTISDIANITTKSHTSLTDVGTNTHSQIDNALSRLALTSGTNSGDQIIPVNTPAISNEFLSSYNSNTGLFIQSQPSHEGLFNLLGGGTSDHYHLTLAQQTALTSGSTTTLHTHTLEQITTAGNTTDNQIISTVISGTAPLVVASPTLVSNLNSDLWDNNQFSDYLNQAVRTTDSPTFNRLTLSTTPFNDSDASTKVYVDDYFPVQESGLFLNDVPTLNATSGKHGFLPKLSNSSTQYLNGAGNWSIPAGETATGYSATSFTNQTSVNVIHNFNNYPIVQVLVSTSVEIPYSITHNTVNDFTVVFTSLQSGSILASIGSPQPQSIITVTNDYSALITNRIIDVTSAGKTITLYTISGNSGREIIIDNESDGDIYVVVSGGGLIQGEITQTISPDNSMTVYAGNNSWRFI